MKKIRNRKAKIMIGSIILIILVALTICLWYFNSLKVKPLEIFTSTIDGVFEKVVPQNNLNFFTGNMNIKTNLTSNDKNMKKILNIINHSDINFKFGIDYNNNVMNTILSSNYDGNELLNISTCIEKNSFYINFKDVYDKTVMIPVKKHANYISAVFNQNDIRTILRTLNSAISGSLQDKYFVKKNTKVSLNGEEVKVTKNILTLNNSNLNKIINDIKENLNNNEQFLSSLSYILNETKEEIKNKISSINSNSIAEIITISLYTKDDKVIGFELAKTSNTGLTLSILKTSETSYSYEIKNAVNSHKGNFEINKSDNRINLIISSNDNKVNGTVSIDINYDKNKDIEGFIKNDIVEIEKITDQERTEMFNKIQQRQSIRNLIKDLWNSIEI